MQEMELTEREEAIAQRAAEIAVGKVMTTFYAQVGKSIVTRFFIYVGIAFVSVAAAKGWVKLG